MKKALQISIAKTLFTIEEDAYDALDTYLASVKQHFAGSEGRDEIVSDIETRIAEQLIDSRESVVTITTVERVIKQMGGVEDFGDTDLPQAAAGTEKKKLYRDGDRKVIAGVASGLAAYFGWNAQWVRLAFLVATCFNGIGLLIYIILWIALPEAKTASQKLEMVGTPVTLGTLSETVSSRMNELETGRSSAAMRALAFPFRMLMRVLRILIGAGFILGAGIGIVAIVISAGFLMSGTTWIAEDISFSTLLPGIQQWIVLAGAMLAGLIPLTVILLTGIALIVKRSLIHVQAILSLLGVWFIALLICGFGAAQVISNYDRIVSTSPQYQEVTRTSQLDAFDSVVIDSGADVTVIASTSTAASLTAHGREKYVGSYTSRIENGVLTIALTPIEHASCLFCSTSHPSLTLAAPSLDSVSVRHGASIRSEALPASSFTLVLDNGSYANLTLNTNALSAALSQGSSLHVSGTTGSAAFTASNGSYIDAGELAVNDATVTVTRGSRADVNAQKTLDATAQNGSQIRYTGSAVVSQKTDGGSSVSSD